MWIFLFLLFLLISQANIARQKSLSNHRSADNSDSARIELLLGLSSSHIHRSHTKSVSFAKQALELKPTLVKRFKGELNVWSRNGAEMEITFTNINTLL